MLILKNIIKDYVSGNETVRAMNDISVKFLFLNKINIKQIFV